jgi:hypothetical protein
VSNGEVSGGGASESSKCCFVYTCNFQLLNLEYCICTCLYIYWLVHLSSFVSFIHSFNLFVEFVVLVCSASNCLVNHFAVPFNCVLNTYRL